MGAGHFSQSGRFDRLKELAVEFAFLFKASCRTLRMHHEALQLCARWSPVPGLLGCLLWSCAQICVPASATASLPQVLGMKETPLQPSGPAEAAK